MKKHLLIASTALGLVLSAGAQAQDDIDVIDNSIAAGDSVAFDDNNANAALGSLAIANSGNGNDLSEDNSVQDSGNLTVADSGNTDNSINDSLNTDIADSGNLTVRDSGNTSDSLNTELDVDAVVAVSTLAGTVTGNTSNTADNSTLTASNSVSGDAFAGAAGVTQFSQNSGANSLAQQSVTVQANMRLSSSGG
ncbi:hypothetical protein [Alkalilimnicola sp. S0819]|uniref:hypothetical protein n=1 Tax=Alkalilimnicola sp. S0819 TaxID=2613922 RepID=UPI0012622C94|nr:hypothetical protein [Alkalilimnicola sp. S0819]KAB7624391.1 hypothetical protein F3N43_06175 [Alkalilimnicola sp. S0819]MPQ16218.1 hypothetical protein [Alkalilimnicola sp. S0819]